MSNSENMRVETGWSLGGPEQGAMRGGKFEAFSGYLSTSPSIE